MRTQSLVYSLCLTAAVTFLSPSLRVGLAYAVPNDFDGDGISDVTSVKTASAKQLVWSARLSSTQQISELGTLGSSDDMIAMAPWLGVGSQIGVASLNKSTGELVWKILGADGGLLEKTFGQKGDLAVSGGDFNGDGTADAIVVRLKDGRALWQVLYNPFTDSESKPTSFAFGQSGDRVFFARADGTAQDWIGVLGKGAGRNSQARMRNLVTGEVRTFTRLPPFASTGDRPRPFAVRQSSGQDLVGFNVVKNGATAVRVFSLSGVEVGNAAFEGDGDAVVGDFNDAPGFELSFQSSSEAGVFSPVNGEIRQSVALDGTLVDEINIKTVGGFQGAVGGTSPASPTDTTVPGGAVGKCSKVIPMPGSYIYKTRGSDHFTDIRRTTIGLILKLGAPGPYPSSCVQVMASNGTVITQLGLYAKGAGWAARYYSGIGCGAATPVGGSAVANLARSASGSSAIIFNMDGTCYGPVDATQCANSASC